MRMVQPGSWKLLSRLACAALLSLSLGRADTITVLSFDDLDSSFSIDPATDTLGLNGNTLTTQYQSFGVIFDSALIADAINQLDSSQTPPRSANNVVVSLGDPVTVTFLTPITSLTGYLNHFDNVTLSAFDAFSNLIGTVGANGDNTGDAAAQNEALSLNNLVISSIRFSSPSNFTLDDLTFVRPDSTTPPPPSVPEPGTFSVLVPGLLAVVAYRVKVRSS